MCVSHRADLPCALAGGGADAQTGVTASRPPRAEPGAAVNTILDDSDATVESSAADDLFDALAGLAFCALAASMFAVVLCGSM